MPITPWNDPPRILIVGAGIGGLAAALSLQAVGFRPTIVEAVARPAPLGVGINVLPHAVRELAELGLLPDLVAAGVDIRELIYLTKDGREIWREPRGLAAGYAWPQVAIHRGALQMLLLQHVQARLGRDAVRFGASLVDLEPGDDGVVARFTDRATGRKLPEMEADLLVAADGIHSAVRRKFYPGEGVPKWNRVTLWRSTTLLPAAPVGPAMLWAGHSRQKFVAYPIRIDPVTREAQLNWICDLKAEGGDTPGREDWNRKADAGRLLDAFQGWRWLGVDVPAIIGTSGDIYEFPMVDRDPLPRWTFGRATLLGDAAHPMYPIGSNGATQAIIDGRVLAFHLATAGTLDAGLARYEADRRPATSRIVLMNREQGPDRVMDLAEERAPSPGDSLDAALPMSERAAIAADYKRTAGFDPAVLNARPSYTPGRKPVD
jgi:2-polyprenyl-6-methoxyphenol hydroxylase-like FAD-dependent oxidoreductase